MAADHRHDYWDHRCVDRGMVHIHLRADRKRHSSAIRPTASSGDSRPLSICAESNVRGAALALAGAALFYESLSLLTYSCVFLLGSHVFVVSYEEPALQRTFGPEYEQYQRRVRRWCPHMRAPR